MQLVVIYGTICDRRDPWYSAGYPWSCVSVVRKCVGNLLVTDKVKILLLMSAVFLGQNGACVNSSRIIITNSNKIKIY